MRCSQEAQKIHIMSVPLETIWQERQFLQTHLKRLPDFKRNHFNEGSLSQRPALHWGLGG